MSAVQAALSPSIFLGTPDQLNPQVRSDLQVSAPQFAKDAQKTAKVVQTDTVTISAQALKMADAKDVAVGKKITSADEQETLRLANDKADSKQKEAQKNAVKAYAAASAG
jgi:hypothetical protein